MAWNLWVNLSNLGDPTCLVMVDDSLRYWLYDGSNRLMGYVERHN